MSLSPSSLIVAPLISRDTIAADLGNYYVASTVPGTGLLTHAVNTTLVETKSMFQVYNGGNLNIYPMFLRLITTVASVGNTMVQFTTTLDQGNHFSAFVAGNALSIVNQNMASQNSSAAVVSAGAVTLTAASANRRIVSHRLFRNHIGLIGDLYQFSFGSGELVDPAGLDPSAAAISNVMYVLPPVVIPPGCQMSIVAWGATFSTGATYEYEFGFVEK